MTRTDPINYAEIAHLVGVGRAAVVNWRRRHPDFPAPVGLTDIGTPTFDPAQVQAWLTTHQVPYRPEGQDLAHAHKTAGHTGDGAAKSTTE